MLGRILGQLEMRGQGRMSQHIRRPGKADDTFIFCGRKMEIDKAARYTREMTLTADCEREQKEKNQVR